MKQNQPLGRGKGGGGGGKSQETLERAGGFVVVFYLTFRMTCLLSRWDRSRATGVWSQDPWLAPESGCADCAAGSSAEMER